MLPTVWHEAYEVDIGIHVYPTRKYRLIRDRLIEEDVIGLGDLMQPEPASDAQVALVHTGEYLDKIRFGTLSPAEQAILEIPFSARLRAAMWLCTGGSILAARLALEHRIALHLGGGFHHAFPDHGEGFCLINDVAIAIRALQQERHIERALVVDLDVHHGNGTAAIFPTDPSVFTFSMHQENNYPLRKPPGDLDIGLEDGTDDHTYLALLLRHLPGILERQQPDLVFYLAGADPYEADQLGGLALTMDGLRRRDELVLDLTAEGHIPIAVVLAGGYAWRESDTVEIHCNTARAAAARSPR
jgi:acetoin utilization deacetylase AcuC-like enzyme